MSATAMKVRARRGAAVLGTLALGALVVDGGWVRHRAIAGPLAVVRALGAAVEDGTLGADVAATVGRTALGVALGALVALAMAAPSTWTHRSVEAPLDFLRAIPPLLVFPLFCLAFGYGEAARVLSVAWAASLTISLHVGAAAAREPGERERALRAMGASPWQLVRFVRSRELVPPLLSGLRQAVATGLVVSVVTEMVIGADAGLGARAIAAQIAYDTPGLWAVLTVAGGVGWAAGRVLLSLEARVAHWRAA